MVGRTQLSGRLRHPEAANGLREDAGRGPSQVPGCPRADRVRSTGQGRLHDRHRVARGLDHQVAGASDRKQATKDLYATLARTHLVPTVGTIPLGRLRPSDVEALVVAKRGAGLSGSTVRTIYTVLRSALDIATRDGLIRGNPAAAVRRPGVRHT